MHGKIEVLLDRLQTIHPNLPLRVSPIEINLHTPTAARLGVAEWAALQHNQYRVLGVWQECLARRFTTDALQQPSYAVRIS